MVIEILSNIHMMIFINVSVSVLLQVAEVIKITSSLYVYNYNIMLNSEPILIEYIFFLSP